MAEFAIFLGVDGRRRGVPIDRILLIEDAPVDLTGEEQATRAIVTLVNDKQFIVEGSAKQLLLAMTTHEEPEGMN